MTILLPLNKNKVIYVENKVVIFAGKGAPFLHGYKLKQNKRVNENEMNKILIINEMNKFTI